MLKLESLNYLYRIYKFNSVKLAAESIPVSPSTVSGAIHKLEREWEMPLLIRTYRGIELTESAKKIASSLEDLFLAVDKVEHLIAVERTGITAMPKTDDNLTLLLSRGWWQGAMQKILPYFLSKGIDVEVPDLNYDNDKYLQIVNQNKNTVLLNFICEPVEDVISPYPDVCYKKISSGHPCVVLRENSQWISQDKKVILPQEVIKLPILRFTEGYDLVFPILEKLENYGKLNIIKNVSSVQVLCALLEADIGIGISCEDSRKLPADKLRHVPIKLDNRFSLVCCYNKNTLPGYLLFVERMLKEIF